MPTENIPTQGMNIKWPNQIPDNVGAAITTLRPPPTLTGVVNTVKNIVTELMTQTQLETTTLPTTTMVQTVTNSNNTVMVANPTEVFTSNNTMSANPTEVFSSNSTATRVNTTMKTIVDAIVTTGKSVLETTTSEKNEHLHHVEDTHNPHEKTLYIVLGVILAALLVIIVILVVIYKRYKRLSGPRAGIYCVSDLNQVSVSSCRPNEMQ